MLNNTVSTTRSGLLLQIISIIMNPCDMCLWSNQNYFRPSNVFNKVLQYFSHCYAKFKCPLCDYLDGFNCPVLFSATSVVKCIERSASDKIFNFYGAGISCSTLFSYLINAILKNFITFEFAYWLVSFVIGIAEFLICECSVTKCPSIYQTITQRQYVIIFELH